MVRREQPGDPLDDLRNIAYRHQAVGEERLELFRHAAVIVCDDRFSNCRRFKGDASERFGIQ